MGEAYKARDTRLDRTVAIKVLASHLSRHADTSFTAGPPTEPFRFASSTSPGGELDVTDNGKRFLVMERAGEPPPWTLVQNSTAGPP